MVRFDKHCVLVSGAVERVRRAGTIADRLTGSMIATIVTHDANRTLDPQAHSASTVTVGDGLGGLAAAGWSPRSQGSWTTPKLNLTTRKPAELEVNPSRPVSPMQRASAECWGRVWLECNRPLKGENL